MTDLSAAETALARSRTYLFFSQLYRHGINQDYLPVVRSIPELAETLDRPFNAEQAAADHHSLFSFNVFPYESIFLDATGMLGGKIAEAVARGYREVGYEMDADATAPDHAGSELGLLGFLSGIEAEAWENGAEEQARRVGHRQQLFLEAHLLRWLVPLTLAIRSETFAFYAVLSELTLDLVASHHSELAGTTISTPTFSLPRAAQPLQNGRTGLKEIAVYLTSPVDSGFFLSRDAVGRLARRGNLPRGFGGRVQMLTNLLRSAAQYDQFSELLNGLDEMAQNWIIAYRKCARLFPQMEVFIRPWLQRTTETLHLLAQMRQQASAGAGEPE